VDAGLEGEEVHLGDDLDLEQCGGRGFSLFILTKSSKDSSLLNLFSCCLLLIMTFSLIGIVGEERFIHPTKPLEDNPYDVMIFQFCVVEKSKTFKRPFTCIFVKPICTCKVFKLNNVLFQDKRIKVVVRFRNCNT